jgi:hypothetical protein
VTALQQALGVTRDQIDFQVDGGARRGGGESGVGERVRHEVDLEAVVVDGVGSVRAIAPDARAQRWTFAAPPPLLRYIAQKGSICVDGVSLTVNAVDDAGFEVALVPHTIEHTAFANAAVGDAVNLEVDLVARYVERLLQTR